jgi:DNA-directed RNA polymerase subunit H (RpoH/RPB5)
LPGPYLKFGLTVLLVSYKVSRGLYELISTMAIDVRDHRSVPEHRKISEEEVEEVLQKYDAEKEDLPKIERTDAALKQMDVEVGDVIEIKRSSPTAGKTTYYRQVIER